MEIGSSGCGANRVTDLPSVKFKIVKLRERGLSFDRCFEWVSHSRGFWKGTWSRMFLFFFFFKPLFVRKRRCIERYSMTISQLERNVKAFDWYQDTPRMKTLFPFPIYRNLKRGNAINVRGRVAPLERSVENLHLELHRSFSSNFFEKFLSANLLFVYLIIPSLVTYKDFTCVSESTDG